MLHEKMSNQIDNHSTTLGLVQDNDLSNYSKELEQDNIHIERNLTAVMDTTTGTSTPQSPPGRPLVKNMKHKNKTMEVMTRQDQDTTKDSTNSEHDRTPITNPLHKQNNKSSETHDHLERMNRPPKLTLSAFRKPEHAVRLTAANPDRILLDDYDVNTVSKVLGHGASSTVRLAKHRITGKKVAVKCVGKHQILRNHLHSGKKRTRLEECEILSSLCGCHDNIINLIDIYETDNQVQMVMEYCAGGELFDAIKRRRPLRRGSVTGATTLLTTSRGSFEEKCLKLSPLAKNSHKDAKPSQTSFLNQSSQNDNLASTNTHIASPKGYTEPQAATIATQLLSALSFLHKRGIVHRDVKPENILLVSDDDDDLNVKLSDFGLARVLCEVDDNSSSCSNQASPLTPPSARRSRAYTSVGSDYYVAPEITFGGGYDTAVDMYSLGVTLYIILSGNPPASKQRCGSSVLDDDDDSSSSDDDSEECTKLYMNKNEGDLFSRFPSVDFPRKQWHHISSNAKNLIRQMLHPDPSLRIKAEDALQHEWILLNKHQRHKSERSFMDQYMMNMNSKSSLQGHKWTFLSSNPLDSKQYGLRREEMRNKRPKKRRRMSSTRCPSLDIRIPPPQNVPISMVELYNRMSNAAAAVATANSCDDQNEVMVEMCVKDEESNEKEQNSCFQNSGAVALSV